MPRVNLSDINADFTENTEPKDERLIELLRQAYTHQIKCQRGMIRAVHVSPFSNFRPKISVEFNQYFLESIKNGRPPFLYVYEKEGDFIMSDDYSAYYLYMESGVDILPCIIMGEHYSENVTEYLGDPFYLDPPVIERL